MTYHLQREKECHLSLPTPSTLQLASGIETENKWVFFQNKLWIMASDNWQYSPQWTSPKQKKTLNDPLHYNHGNWQLAKIDKIVALYFWHLTTGSIHHNEYHQNKGKWPFSNYGNWQLTTPKQKIYHMKLLHFTLGIWQLAIFNEYHQTLCTCTMATDIWPK